MGKRFNLADFVPADLSVPRVDTGREQLAYIAYANLVPDKDNGYSMDGIEELARSIEIVGLQQPLRVRPLVDGACSIISGHRRHAAIGRLIDRGSRLFDNGVPCIVDRSTASTALRELQLLLGNADNRKLTPADEAQQAERISDCIRRLEAEGYEFPGRHRDWVSKLSGMSKSKIGRLEAIRNNLAPQLMDFFNGGALPVTAAYRLSQEAEDVQRAVFRIYGGRLKDMNEAQLEEAIAKRKAALPEKTVPAEAAAPADADRSREDADFFRMLTSWAVELMGKLPDGGTRSEAVAALKRLGFCYLYRSAGKKPGLQANAKGLSLFKSGKPPIFRTWAEVYDMLCAIAIQLAQQNEGPKEEPEPVQEAETAPEWRTGEPQRDGRYLCLVDMNTTTLHEQRCDRKDGAWYAYGAPMKDVFTVMAWWPLPAEDPHGRTVEWNGWDEEDEEDADQN